MIRPGRPTYTMYMCEKRKLSTRFRSLNLAVFWEFFLFFFCILWLTRQLLPLSSLSHCFKLFRTQKPGKQARKNSSFKSQISTILSLEMWLTQLLKAILKNVFTDDWWCLVTFAFVKRFLARLHLFPRCMGRRKVLAGLNSLHIVLHSLLYVTWVHLGAHC